MMGLDIKQIEALLEAALNECRKAREESGRIHAPAPRKGGKKKYAASIAVVLSNRNKTIKNRKG